MRMMIALDPTTWERLRITARNHHRYPKQHAEWLLMQALDGYPVPDQPRTAESHRPPRCANDRAPGL
jgi:plasmid stability protein